MNKFAERLTEALRVKNTTQDKFAKVLDVAQRTVSRWCRGEREPNFDMLIRICKELDESADYLLGLID